MAGRKPEVADIEFLRHFLLSDDPAFSPSELTEKFDMSRQGIRDRLVKLEERGLLESKNVGSVRMFWLTVDGKAFLRERL